MIIHYACLKLGNYLAKFSILLNGLDFHSPEFGGTWGESSKVRETVERQLRHVDEAVFAPTLGGDVFLKEFVERIGLNGDGSKLYNSFK